MTVGDALFVQAIVFGVVAIAMGVIAANTRYSGMRAAESVIAWVAFSAGLASGLASIWMGVTA